MPSVVVAGGSLQCPHGGTASFATGSPTCDAGGKAAVVSGMETELTFAATCKYSTSNGPSPCTTAMAATSGVSTALIVGGNGALTDAASGPVVNAQAPPGTWTVASAGQSTVEVTR